MPDEVVIPPVLDNDGNELTRCPICDSTEDDCECSGCAGCDTACDSVCNHCNECDDCCDCVTCEGTSSGHLCDPDDDDENICSNCSFCVERHCSCSTCDRCDARVDNTCEHCSNCSDHCTCPYCESCEETVPEICPNCDRCVGSGCCCHCITCDCCGDRVHEYCEACERCEGCEGCGCNCDAEVETAEVVEEEVTQQTANITYAIPPRTTPGICMVCGFDPCKCTYCWEHVAGEVPRVRHIYNHDRFDFDICKECHTCTEHCTASAVCFRCNVGTKHHKVCSACNGCPDHCTCVLCHYCEKKVQPADYCQSCCNCKSHCQCPKCGTCGTKSERLCEMCSKCKGCCGAPDSECWALTRGSGAYAIPYRDVHNLKFFRPPNLLGFQQNTSKRDMGIEIEVNNFVYLAKGRQLWDSITKWEVSVKDDGSIGRQPTAFELNLMPSCGDVSLEMLKEITDGLKKIGASPNEKCGIHVHVNCSDVQGDDLKRIVDVYAHVEKALFDLCHPRRLNYTYSTVCGKLFADMGDTGQELRKNLVKHLFYDDNAFPTSTSLRRSTTDCNYYLRKVGAQLKVNKAIMSGSKRYRALNLASYFRRGTIEFRHSESSTDFKDISGWAMTVTSVIDSAVRMTHKQVLCLPKNSRKSLLAVAPEHLHEWIYDKWTRMDALVNSNSLYARNRRATWGI